jgi:hypothetical protein
MLKSITLIATACLLATVCSANFMPAIFDRFNLAETYTMFGPADNTVFVDGFPVVPGTGGVIQDPANKRGWYNLGVGGISVILENVTFLYFPEQNNTCYVLPLGYDAQTEAYRNAGYTGHYITPGFGVTFSYTGLVYDISVCGELANIQMDVDASTGALIKYAFTQPFPSETLPQIPGIEYPPVVVVGLVMTASTASGSLPSNVDDYFVIPSSCNTATSWCERFSPSKRSTNVAHPVMDHLEKL